jgi:hypothetical protein
MTLSVNKAIKMFALSVLSLGLFISSGQPCTVIVASGKATPDGKPLMWKNRDTGTLENKMVYVRGPKYGFVGLVDAADSAGRSVWAGVNERGFAILNTLSSDLGEGEKADAENGTLMARALGECANIVAFENLLTQTNGRRQTASNYCVLDAEGNACVFETSGSGFAKFDTKDPLVAPFGYIVRTNYAYSAAGKRGGAGYVRFERASRLAQTAVSERNLTPKFVLQSAARDLINEKLLSDPLAVPLPGDPATPLHILANDTINRSATASAVVFHGAASVEKAALTTMWVLLGQPVTTAAVPLWAAAEKVPAALSGPKTAPVNDFARAMVAYLYPDRRAGLTLYMNATRLRTYGGEGVLPKLYRIEDAIMDKTRLALKEWENVLPDASKVFEFEDGLAAGLLNSLREAFPDIK